jgi:two-component system sensor histidine kinase CreC
MSRIRQRAIDGDPWIVARVATAYGEGLAASGVQPTVKHFPGLGRVRADTHFSKASLKVDVLEQAADWFPPPMAAASCAELAHALAAMRERLEGKQYVEKYVQNLAHEMKSPLTAIVSASELLEGDMPEAERQRFATLIQEQANRLYLVIERMLQLAKVEQLQRLEDNQPLDLADLVGQVAETRRVALQKQNLSVNIEAKNGVSCRGDAFLLQQAIGNLLDNAIDFSPAGGAIDITLEETSGRLLLKVRDYGEGAPKYALPQIFDRFYSLPRPATGRKSTGIGLPFVREVAHLHGGEVRFGNHPEGGAEVVMEIAAG